MKKISETRREAAALDRSEAARTSERKEREFDVTVFGVRPSFVCCCPMKESETLDQHHLYQHEQLVEE